MKQEAFRNFSGMFAEAAEMSFRELVKLHTTMESEVSGLTRPETKELFCHHNSALIVVEAIMRHRFPAAAAEYLV